MMIRSNVKTERKSRKLVIFTIGHSTRPIDEFIGLLRANGIGLLIDVRTIPKSRHNPQFNSESLARALHAEKIGYVHIKELGGLRHARRDSVNMGWRNTSFRGYADYMQTKEFEQALSRAIDRANAKPAALMCAEAVPWRCHRSLIADALLARGIEALEIVGNSTPKPHKMTPFARVRGTDITYPEESGDLFSPREPASKKPRAGSATRRRMQ